MKWAFGRAGRQAVLPRMGSGTMAIREYRPGDYVERTGIYQVIYAGGHTAEHEVTVLYGRRFPSCNSCGQEPRFYAVRLAAAIDESEHFEKIPR